MTQAQLAEAIHCSVDLISAIERGSRTLTIENAAAMSTVFGVRKECLLCFDDCETDFEKEIMMPLAENVVVRQMEKKAFNIYAGLCGYNVVLIDSSKYADMSPDDFSKKGPQEQYDVLKNISDTLEMFCYSFQDRKGVEVGRCDVNEYNAIIKEISEFAEFKINRLFKGEV